MTPLLRNAHVQKPGIMLLSDIGIAKALTTLNLAWVAAERYPQIKLTETLADGLTRGTAIY